MARRLCGRGRLWGVAVALLAAVTCAAERGDTQEGPPGQGGKLAAASRLAAAAARTLKKDGGLQVRAKIARGGAMLHSSRMAPAQGRSNLEGGSAAPAVSTDNPFSTSSEGLVEMPGTTAAGGSSVYLGGRFRRTLVLRRAADGSVSEMCVADSQLPDGQD